MPGSFTDHLSTLALAHLFGRPAPVPATLWLGLSLTASNRAGEVREPSAPDYRRAEVPNGPGSFLTANCAAVTNRTRIDFGVPATGWGTVVSAFLADAPSGGNVWAIADLPKAKVIRPGVAPGVDAGALLIAMA